jgi:hypothetical protein
MPDVVVKRVELVGGPFDGEKIEVGINEIGFSRLTEVGGFVAHYVVDPNHPSKFIYRRTEKIKPKW